MGTHTFFKTLDDSIYGVSNKIIENHIPIEGITLASDQDIEEYNQPKKINFSKEDLQKMLDDKLILEDLFNKLSTKLEEERVVKESIRKAEKARLLIEKKAKAQQEAEAKLLAEQEAKKAAEIAARQAELLQWVAEQEAIKKEEEKEQQAEKVNEIKRLAKVNAEARKEAEKQASLDSIKQAEYEKKQEALRIKYHG